MKQYIIYWGMITLLGIVHVQELLSILSVPLPFYITSVLIIVIVYFLWRKLPLWLSDLGVKWNGTLLLMQALLLLIYASVEPSWVYFGLFMIFIGIEVVRIVWAKQLAAFSRKVQQFEEQSLQVNETFRQVRSERHDFLKHVSAIHFLLENDKVLEAKTYLDGLVDGYEETNLSIKGERGIVAGVLHQMYRRAKAGGIAIVYDFEIPLSSLPLSDQYMVTLIGNLLSNSIDACEEWQKSSDTSGMITMQFYKRAGLYVLICKNHSGIIPTDIVDGLYQVYGKTTKNGDHEGLGTKLIHDIVKDNQGYLDFVYKNQEFTVKIKIPSIR
ncbi:sensor histidine kinase [Niallia oryzisoli]|uniref:sensor histidine kinase n=1 Tax=Niallia oryzisoli TaxID=1737571 RepID=UPI0037366ACE